MALPAGVTLVTNIKGDPGPAGTLDFVTVDTVPAGTPASVEMVSTATQKGAHFSIPEGLPGPDAVATDTAVAAMVANLLSETRAALVADFSMRRKVDPREFGAVGDGLADDTAAIQAAIDVAPDALVELAAGTYRITAPLVLGRATQLVGAGYKACSILVESDMVAISASGGQGQSVRRLRIANSFVSAPRTTYDVDWTNPTKPVLEDVEISLPDASTGLGGVRFIRNAPGAGENAFMPQLSRVWIRNGHLVIDGVTDGHFVDGYVWAPFTGGQAAVRMQNVSDGWTFASVDVVPSQNGGSGYRLANTNSIKIVGGYVDGSYADIMTGYGINAIDSGRISVAGTQFYNLGRSGIRLQNSHGNTFVSVGFRQCNKEETGSPDIALIGSSYNTFIASSHSQPMARTVRGNIYTEDAASLHNLFDASVLDSSLGNYYLSPLFSGNAGTLGRRNRPVSLWPEPAGTPSVIVPPSSLMGPAAAAAWPQANRAQFHRFFVSEKVTVRFAGIRVATGAGNIQACVVRMNGLNFTRVMDSGVVACSSGMSPIDMGGSPVALDPGEYALVVWVDNATAQLPVATDEQLRYLRSCAEVTYAGGVPAEGSITAWNSNRAVTSAAVFA